MFNIALILAAALFAVKRVLGEFAEQDIANHFFALRIQLGDKIVVGTAEATYVERAK